MPKLATILVTIKEFVTTSSNYDARRSDLTQRTAILAHARGYGRGLALIAASSLLSSMAVLAVPWIAARLFGGVFNVDDVDVPLIALVLVGVLAALTILRIITALISATIGSRIEADFRRDIYAHVQRLPLGFFDHNRQGDLLALLTWEVSRLSAFLSGTLTSIPAALMTGVGAMVILFMINPLLAALLPILLPAYYIVLKIIGRRLRSLATKVQQAEASIFASAEENLEMLPAIKAFTREEVRLEDYRRVINKARRLKVEEQKIYAVIGPTLTFVTALGAIILLLFAHEGVSSERMEATELFGFLFYAALLTGPVGSLANLYGEFNTARGTLERLQHVLQEAPEPGYAKPSLRLEGGGWIAFDQVYFSYRARPDTLCDISFDIRPGEIVALVGDNGAGKSTIIKLLLGFYLPDRGQIKLDGVDIAEMSVQQLRRYIGYVPQRPLLQNGSVKANLTLGLKGVQQAQIVRACKLAQAHEFICSLPEGYRTQIGDHGVRLSGGQRQRIALARALLADPPILILDEATSMYDLDGEAAFVEACKDALAGRTVILITHRPASLDLADRIITLKQGRIIRIQQHSSPQLVIPSQQSSIDRPREASTLPCFDEISALQVPANLDSDNGPSKTLSQSCREIFRSVLSYREPIGRRVREWCSIQRKRH